MAKLLKLRRGTTSQHSSFTGAEGEVTIDTDKDTAVVHDGSTAAGRPLAREDLNNVASASITGRLATGAIARAKIADDAINGDKIADNSITSAHIAPDTVVAADIGPNSVGASELADNSVASANIIDGSIVNADINASAAIAGSKISPDFGSQNIVTTGQVQLNGSYPRINLHDSDNENDFSIRNNNGQFMIHDDDTSQSVLNINNDGTTDVKGRLDAEAGLDVTGNITVSGTVDGRDVASDGSKLDGIESGAKADQTSTEIKALLASDNLTSAHLAPNSVGASEIAADAISTGNQVADNVINSEHYVDGSIDHVHLSNDCVDGDNINDNSINSEHYVNGSIDNEHLADDCVNANKIANDSINSEHYVDGSVDREHLNITNTGSNGQALTRAGSQFTWSTISADGGNAATLDGLDSSQFLRSDTTDQMTSGTLRIASGKLGVGNIDPGNTFGNRSACIALGDNDTGLAQDGDGHLELWANNQEVITVFSDQVKVIKTLKFNNGFGSESTAYGCRVWVSFNGQSESIYGDGNVSSVGDEGSAEYKVNFSSAMPNSNYATGGSVIGAGSGGYNATVAGWGGQNTGWVKLNVQHVGDNRTELPRVNVICFA